MRVLLLGGTGFLGTHLSLALVARGHKIIVVGRSGRFRQVRGIEALRSPSVELLVGDASSPKLLCRLLPKVEAVVNLTAVVKKDASLASSDYFRLNIEPAANLLEALEKMPSCGVKRLILSSSISVYGEGNYLCRQCGVVRPETRYAQPENGFEPPCPSCRQAVTALETPETAERRGQSLYGVVKKTQEDLFQATCSRLNIDLTILRYTTVYGPGQSEGNPYTGFLHALCRGSRPTVHEDGLQTRDFVFVSDVAQAIAKALEDKSTGTCALNIGSGVQTTVLNFAKMLCAMADRPGIEPLITQRLIAGDIRHCIASIGAAQAKLGMSEPTAIADGTRLLVDWYFQSQTASAKPNEL